MNLNYFYLMQLIKNYKAMATKKKVIKKVKPAREKKEIKSEQVKEKKEISTPVPVPEGYIYAKFLQDYGNYKAGDCAIIIERRYKSLKNNGVVK